jgi:uncharacterized membrane protein YbhN (UPF0104 family)
MSARPRFHVEPAQAPEPVEMPSELSNRRLLRRTLQILGVLALVALILLLAPGLGDLRDYLRNAKPGWFVVAVALEALSCLSYVAMFKPIFCNHMGWRTSWEIGWSELGMGSLVPASGIGGLALGAWILREGGMPGERIARRSVAFFIIKSGANFVAVAVIGTIMALHLAGPHLSPWLTAFPAAAAVAVILLVTVVPRLGAGGEPAPGAGRVRRWWSPARRALVTGTSEAGTIILKREPLVILGSLGYWFFDNAVLWATFKCFGYTPPVTVILMGYLIGQLGGLLPLPGGLGGIDAGLLGTLVVYGTPVTVTAAAVLTYRVILFWLPLLVGGAAFVSLRRGLNRQDRPELCVVPAAT